MQLRSGKRALNSKIMNAVIHCQGKYKLSENYTIGFCVDFIMAFDQLKMKEYDPSHRSKINHIVESENEEADR